MFLGFIIKAAQKFFSPSKTTKVNQDHLKPRPLLVFLIRCDKVLGI